MSDAAKVRQALESDTSLSRMIQTLNKACYGMIQKAPQKKVKKPSKRG